ncbi:hypothetical protein EB796_017861 [Bugula neritina]|uniref:Uncharacterized protein n=1 Tax=Bugula neritina TaxID=10212 RepID=A0A7J7JD34_BUGNE|nr:hypothetical protein EB796_017861 [Bugula neritina]
MKEEEYARLADDMAKSEQQIDEVLRSVENNNKMLVGSFTCGERVGHMVVKQEPDSAAYSDRLLASADFSMNKYHSLGTTVLQQSARLLWESEHTSSYNSEMGSSLAWIKLNDRQRRPYLMRAQHALGDPSCYSTKKYGCTYPEIVENRLRKRPTHKSRGVYPHDTGVLGVTMSKQQGKDQDGKEENPVDSSPSERVEITAEQNVVSIESSSSEDSRNSDSKNNDSKRGAVSNINAQRFPQPSVVPHTSLSLASTSNMASSFASTSNMASSFASTSSMALLSLPSTSSTPDPSPRLKRVRPEQSDGESSEPATNRITRSDIAKMINTFSNMSSNNQLAAIKYAPGHFRINMAVCCRNLYSDIKGGLWAPTDCPNKKLKVDNFLANNPISLSQVNEAIEYVDSNDTKLLIPVVKAKFQLTPVVKAKFQLTPVVKAKFQLTPVVKAKFQLTPVVKGKFQLTPVVKAKFQLTPVVKAKFQLTPVVKGKFQLIQLVKAKFQLTPVVKAKFQQTPVVKAKFQLTPVVKAKFQLTPVVKAKFQLTPVVKAKFQLIPGVKGKFQLIPGVKAKFQLTPPDNAGILPTLDVSAPLTTHEYQTSSQSGQTIAYTSPQATRVDQHSFAQHQTASLQWRQASHPPQHTPQMYNPRSNPHYTGQPVPAVYQQPLHSPPSYHAATSHVIHQHAYTQQTPTVYNPQHLHYYPPQADHQQFIHLTPSVQQYAVAQSDPNQQHPTVPQANQQFIHLTPSVQQYAVNQSDPNQQHPTVRYFHYDDQNTQ